MITNGATVDTTVTVVISTADVVRRWQDNPEVPEQVRRAVADGIEELVRQMPFADDYRGGVRRMLHLLIARFSFTVREAQAIVGWYETDLAEQT